MKKNMKSVETIYATSSLFRVAQAIRDIVVDVDYAAILNPDGMNPSFNANSTKLMVEKTLWLAYELRGLAEYACFRATYEKDTLKLFINSKGGWVLERTATFLPTITIMH